MKKLFLTILVAASPCLAAFSQSKVLSNGFYRVQNYGSGHYLYVRDCTGSANSTDTQDLDAIELWKMDDNLYSDPGSIMYTTNQEPGIEIPSYDVESQNTGIHKLTNKYPQLYFLRGYYQVYCQGSYLYDIGCNKSKFGTDYSGDRTYIFGTTTGSNKNYMPYGTGNYRLWSVIPVSSTSDNYFGFKPSVTANGKYYAPFYAAFGYTPVDSKVKTWCVSKVDETNGIVILSPVKGTVAASQPVIVECVGATAADNKADLTIDAGTKATTNLLKGTYFCNEERAGKDHTGKDPAIVKFDSKTMRVLSADTNGNLVFTNSTSIKNIPHNTSYLTVSSNCKSELKVLKLGDANGDGDVDTADAVRVTSYYHGKTTEINKEVADVNNDGTIDAADAVAIIGLYLGK